jgi:hypothetical protein
MGELFGPTYLCKHSVAKQLLQDAGLLFSQLLFALILSLR